jgi:hypothetical protein
VSLGVITVTFDGSGTPPAYQETVTGSNVYQHPSFNYDAPYENDISLIFLPAATASILSSPYIDVIDIPTSNVPTDGVSGTLTGFAITEPDFNYHLKFISAPIMSNAWCEVQHITRNWFTSKMCVDALNIDVTCIEGNGGPLTAVVGGRNTVVGVGAVWTTECHQSHHGVFTRVGSHLTWINSVIN